MNAAGLRLAFRIAYRDARRSRARSALVILLLGLPVFTVALTATTMDSFTPTPSEQAVRDMGTADAIVDWRYDEPIVQDPLSRSAVWPAAEDSGGKPVFHDESDIAQRLPHGTRLTEKTTSTTGVRGPTGERHLEMMGLDLADPMTTGMLDLTAGVSPGRDEVALSHAAAADLEVTAGDEITLPHKNASFEVAALVEDPAARHAEFIVAHPDVARGDHDAWLVDTPHEITWSMVREYNADGMAVFSRAVAADPPTSPVEEKLSSQPATETLSLIGFGIGMVALEIVLLAGPAFVIGAKRRSRELALLAATGAGPGQVRMVVLAGGIILGSVAAVGFAAAGIATAVAITPVVEEFTGATVAGFRVWPQLTLAATALTIVTGALAALVPAFTVARQHIVTVLTGHRVTSGSRRRLVTAGLAMMAGGTGIALLGVGDTTVPALLIGVVLAELGVVLCTPTLVGLIGRCGRFLPLTPRIALRDAGRHRSAAAPAISAIMAVVAVGIAASMFVTGSRSDDSLRGAPAPDGHITAEIGTAETSVSSDGANDLVGKLSTLMRDHLPVTDIHTFASVSCPQEPDSSDWCQPRVVPPTDKTCPHDDLSERLSLAQQAEAARNPNCKADASTVPGIFSYGSFLASGEAISALTGADSQEIDRAQRTLDAGGVVVNDPDLLRDDTATLELQQLSEDGAPPGEDRAVHSIEVPATALHSGTLHRDQVFYSSAAADELGLIQDGDRGVVAKTSRNPSSQEREAFNDALRVEGVSDATAGDDTADPRLTWEVSEPEPPTAHPATITLGLTLASGILALAATAVAGALAAAESRRDLATLGAIGASPGIRRRLNLFQAGVISFLGGALGVVVGLGASFAAMAALNNELSQLYPRQTLYIMHPPWGFIASVLLVVPLVAMMGAGLLTRSRLPSERR